MINSYPDEREEKDLVHYQAILAELIDLFGWTDKTPLHAAMHVRHAIMNYHENTRNKTQSDDLEALARRATTSRNWRWLPGMLMIVAPLHEGDTGYCLRLDEPSFSLSGLPDLTDAATLGCLLALVRQVWSVKTLKNGHTPVIGTSECDGMWEFGYRHGEVRVSCTWGKSEAEVLVWALENGP